MLSSIRRKVELQLPNGVARFMVRIEIQYTTLKELICQIVSPLNCHGTRERFGYLGNVCSQEDAIHLVDTFYDTGGFQNLLTIKAKEIIVSISDVEMPSAPEPKSKVVSIVFQEFTLYRRRWVAVARIKRLAPHSWVGDINTTLQKAGFTVICSAKTVYGWPVKVLVGAPADNPWSLDRDFFDATGGKKSPYKLGTLFSPYDFHK